MSISLSCVRRAPNHGMQRTALPLMLSVRYTNDMPIPTLSEANLEQPCNVLGDIGSGLTGSEIGRYLRECRIADSSLGMTKRIRLYEALVAQQREDRCANNVCAFVQRVMNPVLHV